MPHWLGNNNKYYIKVKEPIRGSKKYLFPKDLNMVPSSWKTEIEAIEAEKRLKVLVQEKYCPNTMMIPTTLLPLCKLWLKSYEGSVDGHDTMAKKARFCKEILGRWGNIEIRDIKVFMAHQYLQDRSKEFTSNNFNTYRKEGVAFYNWLINQELVPVGTTNVFEKVKKLSHETDDCGPAPVEAVKKVISVANQDQKDLIMAYLLTGARKNEILSMTWADVDMIKKTYKLHTRKTGSRLIKTTLHTMPDELYMIFIRKHQNRHPALDYVFWHRYYDQNEKTYIENRYKSLNKFTMRLCKKAKVDLFTLHQLRHLAAAILKEQGASIAELQLFLRHDEQKTTEIYAGHLNNSTKAQTDLLGKFWNEELEKVA